MRKRGRVSGECMTKSKETAESGRVKNKLGLGRQSTNGLRVHDPVAAAAAGYSSFSALRTRLSYIYIYNINAYILCIYIYIRFVLSNKI